MKKQIYDLFARSHRSAAEAELKRLEALIPPGNARVALPFVFKGSGHFRKIAPRQNPSEIEALYQRVIKLKPKRVLEIGTSRGGSLYLWCQAADPDATLISVDMPGGAFGGSYPVCREPFYRAFACHDQKVELIRADSHDPVTLDAVRNALGGEPVDFLFIDGDHRYEGVKADYEMYGPLVRPGGLIGFHDIVARPDQPDIEVPRYWEELKAMHPTEEIIGPSGSGRIIGIGLITVTESA